MLCELDQNQMGGAKKGASLQDAFAKFKRERQREHRLRKYMQKQTDKNRSDPAQMEKLRNKFVTGSKKYVGVPYAKKYHELGSEDFDAPLFLDCCGLVRRVMDDLQEDFGFRFGRYNQAYQFDTLPIKLEQQQMKPGDLIFYTATYYNPKAKKQKYDMVHVEIYLGLEGGGTTPFSSIGGRLQKGRCQIFDDFRFTSKNYHSIEYHFRSIDTWLQGECKPRIDPEHWLQGRLAANENTVLAASSIFGDEEDKAATSGDMELDDGEKGEEEAGTAASQGQNYKAGKDGGPLTFYVCSTNGCALVSAALFKHGWKKLPAEFNFSEKFDLRWVEKRCDIDYSHLKPGQLVNHFPNNHVITSKVGLVHTLREVQEADASADLSFFPESFRLDRAAEITALLDRHLTLTQERTQEAKEGAAGAAGAVEGSVGAEPVWIYKPTSGNCGRGLQMITKHSELESILFESGEEEGAGTDDKSTGAGAGAATGTGREVLSQRERESRTKTQHAIVQRYVTNPLLLDGRKFDMRVYCLVARCETGRSLVFFHNGYLRLSLEPFTMETGLGEGSDHESDLDSSLDSKSRFVHFTNASVQKKHPDYKRRGADTIWDFARLSRHLQDTGMADESYISERLTPEMKAVMVTVIKAAAPKLADCGVQGRCFDLLGFDFLLDDTLKLHLLEINTNPALHLDCAVMESLLPKMVSDCVSLVLEAQPPRSIATATAAAAAAVKDGGASDTENGFELLVDEEKGFEFAK